MPAPFWGWPIWPCAARPCVFPLMGLAYARLVVILKMLDTGGCLSMRQLVGIGLVITGFVLVVLDVVGLGAEGRGEKEKGGR